MQWGAAAGRWRQCQGVDGGASVGIGGGAVAVEGQRRWRGGNEGGELLTPSLALCARGQGQSWGGSGARVAQLLLLGLCQGWVADA